MFGRVAIVLWLLAVPALADTIRAPADGDHRDAATAALTPVLQSSGQSAVVFYPGTCRRISSGLTVIDFPSVAFGRAASDTSGLAAVRDVFRNDHAVSVQEDGGVVWISVHGGPVSLLDKKIRDLHFGVEAQYTSPLALMAAFDNTELRASIARLGLRIIVKPVNILVAPPQPDAPHMPPDMRNVSLRQVLSRLAKTFRSIVYVGSCGNAAMIDSTLDWLGDDTTAARSTDEPRHHPLPH
ncbi:MAG: hypothetical protein JSR60_14545 [Proteobacteria bacterium]|nr:hypothetical protein [Pseudomonadota bacterium]